MTKRIMSTIHGTALAIALVAFAGCSSAGTDGGDGGGSGGSDLPLYENYITLLADDGAANDDFKFPYRSPEAKGERSESVVEDTRALWRMIRSVHNRFVVPYRDSSVGSINVEEATKRQ